MSASYTSTLQKRKTSKTKSKHTSEQQHADNGSAAPNERLQRSAANDKLDTIRKQHLLIQQKQQIDARNLCNGIAALNAVAAAAATSVTCCRDVNCRFNAPLSIANSCQPQQQQQLQQQQPVTVINTAAAAIVGLLRSSFPASNSITSNNTSASSSLQQQQQQQQQLQQKPQQQRADSTFSHASINSDGSSDGGSSSSIIKRYSAALTSTTSQRDGSPDSGVEDSNDDELNSFGAGRNVVKALDKSNFTVTLHLDLFNLLLFLLGLCTRFYRLATPHNVVFDEIHYGKYITLYARNTFFFDQHPPLGKQLIAGTAWLAGYNGNFTFPHIGAAYDSNVPIFWLRFVPALCGSLLAPAVYILLLEVRLNRWTALLGGLIIIFDNALLTQSRFILMESMLLLFCTIGIYFLLKFQRSRFGGPVWLICGLCATSFLTFAASIKYIGILTGFLAAYLMCRYLWQLLQDPTVSDFQVILQTLTRIILFGVVPLAIYVGIFYIHLQTLYRAGPHDSVMTSAFQASLEGGLASITKGQPLKVAHGSQITLRHTHGRTCWLHSHPHVYPVRYPDKRGSSHQQQVTCYSFKDVNNWWIVKRPERDDLLVEDNIDVIRHGDIIQLVHGITSRALNSHDVAGPVTPTSQEVTCYIDYEINMKPQLLWRVDILNRDTEGPIWHAIKSQIRLIHVSTGAALRFSGRLLPPWGFNQHEVIADRNIEQIDTVWNVEEHRYTKAKNQRERERQLLSAEMIPTKKTRLTFFEKFFELQSKMIWSGKQTESHMYSSEPLEWPLLDKGIAYWVDKNSNGQIHLLGNILLWYTGTLSLIIYAGLYVFYLLRRRRLCYDLPPRVWQKFIEAGDIFFIGYLIHYIPYFFVDHILFLHNYFPALLFKLLLMCYVIEHIDYILRRHCGSALWWVRTYRLAIIVWLCAVIVIYMKFLALSYGMQKLSSKDLINLRWKDTWDFILRQVQVDINV